MRYVRRQLVNIVDGLRERYSALAHQINHNQPAYNGIRYQRSRGNSLNDLRNRAELIRELSSEEERDTIRIRIDCVNALAGEGIIFDLDECPRKDEIIKELQNVGEEIRPWGDALRLDGRDKGAVFYRVLGKVYGKKRFRSTIFRGDGSWNGRGTLLRI